MKLLITIDTEEDDAWSDRQVIETRNVAFIGRFQELCDRYAFPPTWLTDEPVLADPAYAEVLGDAVAAGRAEIGAHLHPWACRPFPGDQMPDQSEKIYPHELGESEFRAKMERILSLAESGFGKRPVSYRAGRWGFAPEHIGWLSDMGIRIDCSVTPHISWKSYLGRKDGNGGIDYRGAERRPYWIHPDDVKRPGSGPMLELPMSVFYLGGPFQGMTGLGDQLRYSPVGKVLVKLQWHARPFRPWPGRGLGVLRSFYDAAREAGLPYLMLMFHSSELMPGGSPYNPDGASVERMYEQLDALFQFLTESGVTGSTLEAFAEPYFDREAQAEGRPALVGSPARA